MAKVIGLCKEMPHYVYPDSPPDWRAHMEEQDAAMQKLEAASKEALETGNPIGFIMSFQVADGYANYRVVKAKPLQLELIPYSDSYQIPAAHVKGLSLKDVMIQMERKKAWAKIFGQEVT